MDLLDQRTDLTDEIRRMEQELKQLKREKIRLKASGLSNADLVVAYSLSGESQCALAESRAPGSKTRANKSPRDTLACLQKRGRSTISHT